MVLDKLVVARTPVVEVPVGVSVSLTDAGGVPDYTGVPLYDGQDQTRISFTDNTAALVEVLTSSAGVVNGTKYLYVPAGHYGFGGGTSDTTIVLDASNLPYSKLVIFGDGMETSVLDYVKEYSASVGRENEPGVFSNEGIRLIGLVEVVYSNITLKCTTKTGFVTGTANSNPVNDSIYSGRIWFAQHYNCGSVVAQEVRAERGNPRTISIDGSLTSTSPAVTKVKMIDCEGRYSTASGWWLRGVSDLEIMGGRFYRNGNLGVTATGYGVTANQYVSNIYVKGAEFYENYRKGFDKHGGIGTVRIDDCSFRDNIMFQTSYDHQYFSKYPEAAVTHQVMNNCNFLFGANLDFCNEAIAAIDFQYRNHFTALVNDNAISGTAANRLASCKFNNCTVQFLPGITQTLRGYNGIVNNALEAQYNNLTFDIRNVPIERAVSTNAYYLQPFIHSRIGCTVSIVGGRYDFGNGLVTGSAGASNSLAFTSVASARFIADSALFDMQNYVLIGSTSGGNAVAFGGVRKISACTFKIRNLQLNTHNFTQTSGLRWLESAFFVLPSVADSTYGSSNKLGLGDANTLYDWNVGVNASAARCSFSMADKSTSSEVKLYTPAYDGNVQLSMQGTMSHAAETYRAWWNSSLTQAVITGATTIASRPTVTNEAVQYRGSSTNFLLSVITVYFVGSLQPTATYNVELSLRNQNLPALLGMAK